MAANGVSVWRTCKSVKSVWDVMILLWILTTVFLVSVQAVENRIRCYDGSGRAQRCIPPFVNAAFGLNVEATNTCGLTHERTVYCLQTGITGATTSCEYCDARDPNRAHPAAYLTDFHNNEAVTWWQSETMLEGIQHPTSVNLSLNLGKAFDITYVRLKFHSSRPESFAIYKRTNVEESWIPYQFYSSSCEDTYSRRTRDIITRDDETKAICTNEFSDISPLRGGSVAFSTLEGRPSAYDYEHSPILQDWVTATDIRIVLNRLNTFGDEVFEDPSVLKSYFYAISDFAVGGRCKCNGHASECVKSTGQGLEELLVCRCEHNTKGPDCGECLPFYNDRPWSRATAQDAHACQACNCNGLSNRCFFDEELFQRTGHGGHCLDCKENTAGPNCDRCKDYHYRRTQADRCEPCSCDPTGSMDLQCDRSGRCRCKQGVTGERCDRCQANFFDFGQSGCRPCQCEIAGSYNDNPECLPDTGICTCKEFVEGRDCDSCKPGYFNLKQDNPLGCTACFCYGHSSICTSARGFTRKVIHAEFGSGRQKWRGEAKDGSDVPLEYNALTQDIGAHAGRTENVYFVAPDRYLGDQRLSYNQLLTFTLRVGDEGARASILDVVLEGDGLRVSAPIYSQNNSLPRTLNQEYKFHLNEHSRYQWTPRVSSMQFQKLLANLTAIKIRGTYNNNGVGFLDNVKLESARQGGLAETVSHIEQCTCPEGYVGQYCESCAPGFHRDPPNGGPYARCVPCNCNGHSDTCDSNTGRCICKHNTVGENCERCESGYYGYALAGTPNDCKRCPCPDGGQCVEMLNGEVACINCKEGHTGNRCELCADGYWGDPTGRWGARRDCQKCACNKNIDPNAVANCNTTTGECLKCIHNTTGWFCNDCLSGYYGDALKRSCKSCQCYPPGSFHPGRPNEPVTCDQTTGRCPCQVNVAGRMCRTCLEGYWNIDSGHGCERCNCDLEGSDDGSCDIKTGQCACKPGVGGRRCDECLEHHYGFSRDGCPACNCDPQGSYDQQCDTRTGQCICKVNVVGLMCNRCAENKYNISIGCIDCPACYSLVQEQVNMLREKLSNLQNLINNIGENPKAIDDVDFRRKMSAVNDSVNDLLRDAREASGGDASLAQQLDALRAAISDVMMESGKITNDYQKASKISKNGIIDITAAERSIADAEAALERAENYIDTEGKEALQRAREAQRNLGQQSERMTDIAKRARAEAEKQEEEAAKIKERAEQALSTSNEALKLAQEALRQPSEVARANRDLMRKLDELDSLYEQTKSMSENALKKAEQAYDESLTLYTTSQSIVIKDVDVDRQKSEAADIKRQAAEIKKRADELMAEHRNLMDDVGHQRERAEKMLENGIQKQQAMDELLAEADAARGVARDAVARAEKTLKDARDTLQTLKEFDEKVQENKDEAEESLKKIPDIEKKIKEATDLTHQSERDLRNAMRDAQLAKQNAEQAENIAQMASDNADLVRQEASDTKMRAMGLMNQTDNLTKLVEDAVKRFNDYEKQAQQDEEYAKEALEKADLAKSSALDSLTKVKGALNQVDDILRQLAGLDKVDADKLEDLEDRLNEAEQELVDADIEEKYNMLVLAAERQNKWVEEYNSQWEDLSRDVENVKKINETIPRTCFSKATLEPTAPTILR